LEKWFLVDLIFFLKKSLSALGPHQVPSLTNPSWKELQSPPLTLSGFIQSTPLSPPYP
jgi:hypothetical protein